METMAQDYYQMLGLSKSASQDEIQKAYRKFARKYHPDLNPDDKVAQQKFKDIQLAYDTLSDAEKRKLYDQYGPEYERVQSSPFRGGAGGGPGGGAGFEQIFGGGAGPGGFQFEGDLGDLFRQFTGGAPGGAARGGGRARPSKGRDLSIEHTIPFNTAVLGGEASIAIRRDGKTESLQVKIPPGVESGKKIRLRGQGEAGPGGGAQGDLIVTLNVANHPFFKRSGQNLELRLPITIGEAIHGTAIDLPTPGGTVTLKIPPGSSSGRRLRVKGQGVRDSSGIAGDLFVELQIKLPEPLSAGAELSAETLRSVEHIESLYAGGLRTKVVW
jgi:DnaJ-class molecular chaperone